MKRTRSQFLYEEELEALFPEEYSVPANSTIIPNLLDPSTLENILLDVYQISRQQFREGTSLDFTTLLATPLDISSISSPQLREEALSQQNQLKINKTTPVIDNNTIPPYANAATINENNEIIIDTSSFGSQQFSGELFEAVKDKQRVDIEFPKDIPIVQVNVPYKIIETKNKNYVPDLPDNIQIGDIIPESSEEPDVVILSSQPPVHNTTQTTSLNNLINNNVCSVTINGKKVNPNTKTKKKFFSDRKGEEIFNKFEKKIRPVTKDNRTFTPSKPDEKPPTPINVNKNDLNFESWEIRREFNKNGIRCSLQKASLIRRSNLLSKTSIAKMSILTYFFQKHRYNRRKGEEPKRSHPTVTKRVITVLTILFMRDDEKAVLDGLKNIVIGQPHKNYLGSDYGNLIDGSSRLGNYLPSKEFDIPIEGLFTNLQVKT